MFVLTLARFHCRNPRVFVLQGYDTEGMREEKIRACIGKMQLPVRLSTREGLAIRQKYFARGIGYENIDREYDIWITLPETAFREPLQVFQKTQNSWKRIYRCSAASLIRRRGLPDGYLETFHHEDGKVSIGGWAVGSSDCQIRIYGSDRKRIPANVKWFFRQDILDNYPELSGGGGRDSYPGSREEEKNLLPPSLGFEISFREPDVNSVSLVILADGQVMKYPIRLDKPDRPWRQKGQSIVSRAAAYLQRNGLSRTLVRTKEKILEQTTGKGESYQSWRKKHLPSAQELLSQRETKFPYEPLISLAVPLYRTPRQYLDALIASMEAQTYPLWELCFSDGSGAEHSLEPVLKQAAVKDSRIRYICSDTPLGISENTNRALSIVKGEFVAFADHDDLIAENALYEFVKAVNDHPKAELFYSDEDKVSMDGKTYFEPHFKPDFNIDLLCSMNYICHMVMVSRDLLERCGGIDPAFEGAQDYDLVLRCAEKTDQIVHIPKALYHWRSHRESTAQNPESKRYAFEAGMRAVQAHYDRCQIEAKVSMGAYPGLYVTDYIIPMPQPKVTVIIPNKDHVEDLQLCLESIFENRYYNLQILIIENNSTQDETFAFYEQIQAAHKNVKVLTWEKPFNFAAINNYGASFAEGEYLLLLNNDTQMIGKNCIASLVGPALRPEVGAVGALLHYPDHTIQHAGVIIGYGGIAGHAFQNLPSSENGYFSRVICTADLSAVTAACMLVPRRVFEELGGMDETFEVAFNDIDFCLRIRESGRLIVYQPQAQLIHYESKSRGYEDTPGKIARFNKEADLFLKKWPGILKAGDPYYNPNLSLDRNDFGLK